MATKTPKHEYAVRIKYTLYKYNYDRFYQLADGREVGTLQECREKVKILDKHSYTSIEIVKVSPVSSKEKE